MVSLYMWQKVQGASGWHSRNDTLTATRHTAQGQGSHVSSIEAFLHPALLSQLDSFAKPSLQYTMASQLYG